MTPHDTDELAIVPRALIAAVGGSVSVEFVRGGTGVFALTAGVPLDIAPSIVLATGTTATGIKGLL